MTGSEKKYEVAFNFYGKNTTSEWKTYEDLVGLTYSEASKKCEELEKSKPLYCYSVILMSDEQMKELNKNVSVNEILEKADSLGMSVNEYMEYIK